VSGVHLVFATTTLSVICIAIQTYFPTTAEREHLAQLANLTPSQVQVWFQVRFPIPVGVLSQATATTDRTVVSSRPSISQNQRQKQRRVLHDSTTSQEEKNKLAELQHSPRTRGKLTVDAARMTNDPAANDYVQCGLLPSSSAGRRSPPGEPYARHSSPTSPHYTPVLPSREYVPPKGIVSRMATMSSRTWDEHGRDAYHPDPDPSHVRRTSLQGWESEHSPPPTGFLPSLFCAHDELRRYGNLAAQAPFQSVGSGEHCARVDAEV
jgi:hypothetical protein